MNNPKCAFRFRVMRYLFGFLTLLMFLPSAQAYPIDGYLLTGIRRLLYWERILDGTIKGTAPISGAQKKLEAIKLNLLNMPKGDSLSELPMPDAALQKAVGSLFPYMHESYSLTLLDITPGRPIRYAKRQEDRGFQPGSVGKLAVITGFFCELQNIFPDDFEARRDLMKNKSVRAGQWALSDEHTVPFFNPETNKLVKRTVQAGDVFTLYEWVDHMVSVSNNGAASVVWREAILMHVFKEKYPDLTEEEAEVYFSSTPKSELSDVANSVVNEPLRDLGITEDEWRLGQLFTRGGTNRIPPKGGSIGTPLGLMKWLVALERGKIIDEPSSLEIKRLLYMTDRRIRYASNASLKEAAVYFKSGSLYQCKPEEGYTCAKYMGNINNYMNSVCIVEHPDGTIYLVALMSNVLKKNSANDHNALAGRIDKLMHG
ncbi:MAG TPA: serine hydrolase [Saprospiraceae bacterium]|nr:serine hydrolase [Saprospiraceae bacterium]